jgi:hypothetical protein
MSAANAAFGGHLSCLIEKSAANAAFENHPFCLASKNRAKSAANAAFKISFLILSRGNSFFGFFPVQKKDLKTCRKCRKCRTSPKITNPTNQL